MDNIRRRRQWSVLMCGQDLTHVAREGRRELARLAGDYTRQYANLPLATQDLRPDEPLIMAGHQPQLFHVGVWYKNFSLDRLAKQVRGRAIHWIVDNDLCGAPTIRVPTGSISDPRVESVPYDQPAEEIPYEERTIQDRAILATFSQRVHQHLQPLVANPFVDQWWPRAVEAEKQHRNLGRCLAQARHEQELEWGSQVLELPLSQACETLAFRTFLLHLLADLKGLHCIYNESLADYRRANKVRSRSHPAPRLEQADDWWEAPLWVWTADDSRRRRLFVRQSGDLLQLSDLKERWEVSSKYADGVQDLADFSQQGVKVRPRALVTTMYARLVLCDLFVHGIGGGKYDQLTDLILQRWLRVDPPHFQVATATARLPIPRTPVREEELRHVNWQLRELEFNPDRQLDSGGPASALIREKRQWLEQTAPDDGRRRHVAIRQINAALQPHVADRRLEAESRREALLEALRKDKILTSREFSFCLFPEQTLRSLLLDNA